MTDVYYRLLEAWQKEKRSRDLQILPEDFYNEIKSYISSLKKEDRVSENNSLKGNIVATERENAERLLNDTLNIRLKKIVWSELDNIAIANSVLTREERAFQADLRELLSNHESKLKSILVRRVPQVEMRLQPKTGLMVVRFLKSIPAIMGINMKTYGPFKPEDVASLPVENAENLIRRGIAKEVEIPE